MIEMDATLKVNELAHTNRFFYEQRYPQAIDLLLQAGKDFDIIKSRMKVYDQNPGPRVGDFIKLSHDHFFRFTADWTDRLQTGSEGFGYYLGENYISYSGGLDPAVPKEFLEPDKNEPIKQGTIWIFSNGWPGANRGVSLTVPFRVFRISHDKSIQDKIIEIIKYDKFPEDHPLLVCDREGSQFKKVLGEYYLLRNAYKTSHHLLKDCIRGVKPE